MVKNRIEELPECCCFHFETNYLLLLENPFLIHSSLESPIFSYFSSFLTDNNHTENLNEQTRRKIAAWTITCLCIGVFVLALAASANGLSRFVIHFALVDIYLIAFFYGE